MNAKPDTLASECIVLTLQTIEAYWNIFVHLLLHIQSTSDNCNTVLTKIDVCECGHIHLPRKQMRSHSLKHFFCEM